ncbi:helix-turn-helix domain-containing protein [Pseudomarimonas arenosa]|uniref:Putative Fis-like DNA-binding protein n=1 Tax=Pseudomarimonas arenosa TaxID=2774145 RepID=A0AAW3ZPQ0_9GAMM|nr:helix-turn-helix domain-containing protein [Pseudomarimonas arenosa]MBD8528091.1 Fis family transcriptional regulator [Pseudomarimonas arenosa]
MSVSLNRGEKPATSPLQDHVSRAVRRYLIDLGDCTGGELHALVLREVERPLFNEVMNHFEGNQTRAAAALGINRATLRKRLREFGLD